MSANDNGVALNTVVSPAVTDEGLQLSPGHDAPLLAPGGLRQDGLPILGRKWCVFNLNICSNLSSKIRVRVAEKQTDLEKQGFSWSDRQARGGTTPRVRERR